ncbi:VOC family protein [Pedobacter boryungensis]|uniref:VOC domain-containing protein n=1 Tax=Pedobacter boryungensis TaxID=869962 RepID=A0ABX2DJG1_9SPHI|nr:hypothetical protein [Pedobacter boryungensis]NQX33071.1 hypothetical protein [Pedobacter boryungensis]
MKLELEYTCLKVKDVEEAVIFLKSILDLELENVNDLQKTILVTNSNHKIELQECIDHIENQQVLLLTKDCIQDFYTLKSRGVYFVTTPDYTSLGLMAEFLDLYGNSYRLLEERNYKLN